jgi:hypothetical protein
MTANRTESAFRLQYAVSARIAAAPEVLWRRLTDAAGFPSWNSTVTRIEGEIALGQKLALTVPVAPGRTFTPSVVGFEPNQRMVWADGFAPMFKGERTFTLTPQADGTTEFAMVEVFAGVMLPLIKGSLPDMVPVFETYAADLKRVCEAS